MDKDAIKEAINEDPYEPKLEGYEFEQVDSTGAEGDGALMSYIYRVTDEDGVSVNFRINGYYSSWDSNNFNNDAHEVEQYEKTVTDWRAV